MSGHTDRDDVIRRHVLISEAMAARGWARIDQATAARVAETGGKARPGSDTRPPWAPHRPGRRPPEET